MAPELALGFPAAGAVLVAALHRRRPLAIVLGGVAGAAGVVALLPLGPALERSVLGLALPPPGRAFALAAAAALAMAVTLAPPTVDRVNLLSAGLAGLAGLAALAVAPDAAAIGVVVLLLAAGHAAVPGRRTFAARMRGPAFGAVVLAGAQLLVHDGGPPAHARLAALGFVLGLVAVAGLVPFLPEFDPQEPVTASPIVWTGFLAPAVAFDLLARVQPMLAADAVPVYGSLLVGMGLLNMAWGILGAWKADDDISAWRYSFLADWGLALTGLGLVTGDGVRAAYLALVAVVLVRLPLYLWARPVLRGRVVRQAGSFNLLIAAALAGAAPFAGFIVRLLLLRAASQVYWPLALILALAMVTWIAHAVRLGRSLGTPVGRGAAGVMLTLAISLLLGIAPAAALAVGGL